MISVLRATEIVLALIVDQVVDSQDPGGKAVLHVIGAVVVLLAVSLMAASEHIQRYLDECRQKSQKLSDSETSVAML